MTDRTARKWVIRKWEWIVEHGEEYDFNTVINGAIKAIPKLEDFLCGCAYCQTYYVGNCIGCPVVSLGEGTCLSEGHPHLSWSLNPTKENAQKMLDFVRKT